MAKTVSLLETDYQVIRNILNDLQSVYKGLELTQTADLLQARRRLSLTLYRGQPGWFTAQRAQFKQLISDLERALSTSLEQEEDLSWANLIDDRILVVVDMIDVRKNYYEQIRKRYGFKSTWCMHGVGRMDASHPYTPDAFVTMSRWTERCAYRVEGSTWLDVYRAADLAIRESNDTENVSITGFEVRANNLIINNVSADVVTKW